MKNDANQIDVQNTVPSSEPRSRISLLVLFALVAGLLQTAAASTSYKVQQINPPGSISTYAIGINTASSVVGNFTTSTGVVHGYKFAAGKYTTITFPHSNKFTRANGINDSNLIVGDFFGTDNFYHGFTFSGGKYTQYDVQKGVVSTSIFDVNNNGDFVGAAGVGGPNQGFINIGGTVTEFYGSGTDNTYALGINNTDAVVGQYYDSSNNSHGFLRSSTGVITEIIYPGAVQTACLGINDSGVITGWYINTSGQSYGFTDTAGVFQSSDFFQNSGINNNGAFVTYYVGPAPSGTQQYGLLVTPHTMKKALSTVTVSKALSTSIYGVNNTGAMTGWYENSSSIIHGLLLVGNTLTNLDDPSAQAGTTIGQGINSTNQVVGAYTSTSSVETGFLYSGGTYSDIVPPGSTYTTAQTLNDSGVIAGAYFDASNVEHGFTYNGSTYTTVDVPGAVSSFAWGINATGEVTLSWVNSFGNTEGSLYNGSTFTTINVPGALDSFPHAINKSGAVAFSWSDFYGNFHGALLNAGSYYVFDDPNGTGTRADGINDTNLMVGRFLQAGSTTLYDGFKGTN
jgi:hypothetical protein